jgi:Zn finger protein HypA/HybF involved in hydrogenase expression
MSKKPDYSSPYKKQKKKGPSLCLKCQTVFMTYDPVGNRQCPGCAQENEKVVTPRARIVGLRGYS